MLNHEEGSARERVKAMTRTLEAAPDYCSSHQTCSPEWALCLQLSSECRSKTSCSKNKRAFNSNVVISQIGNVSATQEFYILDPTILDIFY